MKIKYLSLSIALIGTTLSLVNQAQASGYDFGVQSVSAQGTSNANGAEAGDASVLYSNAAAMTRLQGTNVSLMSSLVLPNVNASNISATNRNGAAITTGSEPGNAASTVVVPQFY